jgi:hypothetical protein
MSLCNIGTYLPKYTVPSCACSHKACFYMTEDTDTEPAVTDINAPTNATMNPSTSVTKAYQMVHPECNMTNRQHHTHSKRLCSYITVTVSSPTPLLEEPHKPDVLHSPQPMKNQKACYCSLHCTSLKQIR